MSNDPRDNARKPDYFAEISAHLASKLENGIIPWRTSETPTLPINAVTGRPFAGFNALNLMDHPSVAASGTSAWATFQQVKAAGGAVEKGAKAAFGFSSREVDVTKNGQPVLDGAGQPKRVTELDSYSLFHASQLKGIPALPAQAAPWREPSAAAAVLATPIPAAKGQNVVLNAVAADMSKVLVAAHLGTRVEPSSLDVIAAAELLQSNKRAFHYASQQAQRLAEERLSINPDFKAQLQAEKDTRAQQRQDAEFAKDAERAQKALKLLAENPDAFRQLPGETRAKYAALAEEYARRNPDDEHAAKGIANLSDLRARHAAAHQQPAPVAAPAPGM